MYDKELYAEFIKNFWKSVIKTQTNQNFNVQTPEETLHKRKYVNDNKSIKSAQHHIHQENVKITMKFHFKTTRMAKI